MSPSKKLLCVFLIGAAGFALGCGGPMPEDSAPGIENVSTDTSGLILGGGTDPDGNPTWNEISTVYYSDGTYKVMIGSQVYNACTGTNTMTGSRSGFYKQSAHRCG